MDDLIKLETVIKEFVTELYTKYAGNELMYHNLEHTEAVLKNIVEIAASHPLDSVQLFILRAAAWFHDTGHLSGPPALHEERSVAVMKSYLHTIDVSEDVVRTIANCIYATKLPQKPNSILDKILCDADTYHFGTKAFEKADELLKVEMELRNMSLERWDEATYDLLTNHRYFTAYCKELLNPGKEENIELIKSRLSGTHR